MPQHTIPQTQSEKCTSHRAQRSPRGHAILEARHRPRSAASPLRREAGTISTGVHAPAHSHGQVAASGSHSLPPRSPAVPQPPLPYRLRSWTRSAGFSSPSSAVAEAEEVTENAGVCAPAAAAPALRPSPLERQKDPPARERARCGRRPLCRSTTRSRRQPGKEGKRRRDPEAEAGAGRIARAGTQVSN